MKLAFLARKILKSFATRGCIVAGDSGKEDRGEVQSGEWILISGIPRGCFARYTIGLALSGRLGL